MKRRNLDLVRVLVILIVASLALTLGMATVTRASVERAACGLRHETSRGG